MCDDLANGWGYRLTNHVDKRNGESSLSSFYTLEREVQSSTNGRFSLSKLVKSGSDANLWAIDEATNGKRDTLLIACGSYVAGDRGMMQALSTSSFSIDEGSTDITPPNEVDLMQTTKQQTIALPYHIPCDVCKEVIRDLELQCMMELHHRCLYAVVAKNPIKAILLELVLAGNGAVLSDRALVSLGKLAIHHRFQIIVDEIMTGGRCGPYMLRTLSTPGVFMSSVSHVTMGKWTSMGLCLVNQSYESTLPGPSRGSGTTDGAHHVHSQWKIVQQRLKHIESRRSSILKTLKLKECEAWGVGLLIFAPKFRKDSGQGLKNRFLPLCEDVKVDKVPFRSDSNYSICLCCERVRIRVSEWCNFSKGSGNPLLRTLVESLSDGSIALNDTERKRTYSGKVQQIFTRTGGALFLFKVMNEGTDLVTGDMTPRKVINDARKAGLISIRMLGNGRLRYMVIESSCKYPQH